MIIGNLIPWRARPNFRRDATSAVLSGIYVGGIFPFVAFVARDQLGASGLQLGLISAAPFVGNLLALPLSALLTRGERVRAVVVVIMLSRIILVGASFVSGSAAFAWVVFFALCLGAISGPTYASVLRLIYPLDWIGRLLSYTRVVLAAGAIIATFIAGAIIESGVSYRWVFLGFAPLGIAAMLVFSRIRIPSGSIITQERSVVEYVFSSLRILKDDIAFRWFALAVFVYGFGNLMTIPVYTMYQVDILGITPKWLASLSILAQITWMASYVLWGRIIDQVSPLKIVFINTLLATILPLNHIFATEVWMLVPMFVVTGVVNAGIELSYFNSVMYFSTPENSIKYQGIHSLLLGVRGVIAPFAGAGLAQWINKSGGDIRWVFLVGMLLVLVGALLQWRGMKYPLTVDSARIGR